MTVLKKCFKCGVEKETTEFYRHPRMGDGLLGKCKECAKADVSQRRLDNIEYVRKYDRDRGKTEERKARTAKITRKRRAQDPRYAKCHSAVARAIRNGVIVKSPCSRCGATKAMAHHDSYDKPLEVIFLCQPCHKVRHKELDDLGLKP